MTGNEDLLRVTMRDLADEVQLVDLRPRVRRTARRLTVQRTVTVTAGVTVLLLAGSAVVNEATSNGLGPTIPGATASPRQIPSHTVNPLPSQSPQPSSTDAAKPRRQIDTVYFLEDADASQRPALRLVSWAPGQANVTVIRELPRDAWHNANLSPDGRWVSWVDGDEGPLHVADLRAGGQEQTIPGLEVEGLRFEPIWARDSKHLLVRSSTGQVGTVDVDRRSFSPLPTNLPAGARHAACAADGSSIAFVTTDGAVMVAKPDGSAQRKVPNLEKLPLNGRRIIGVQSLSIGYGDEVGQWVHLYAANADRADGAARSLVSNLTVNATDGRQTSGVGGIGAFEEFQSTFRNDPGLGNSGQLLWRTAGPREFRLEGPNGQYLDGSDVPAALNGYRMLNL